MSSSAKSADLVGIALYFSPKLYPLILHRLGHK